MNYFKRRKYRKYVKHIIHEAKHAYHMREDIANADDLRGLQEARLALEEIWREKRYTSLEAALETLSSRIQVVYPPQNAPRVRETVEIIAVALIVAWGLRTYFIQPFKIPTGSMQPTLFGISAKPPLDNKILTSLPFKIGRYLIFGERDVHAKAKAAGKIGKIELSSDSSKLLIPIDTGDRIVTQRIPRMPLHISRGQIVGRGDTLASGRVIAGDHIFVDKVRYNFMRPKRGDIFVFSTRNLVHSQIKTNQYYIKRLCAVPGDTVSVQPPYLVIDGERLVDPKPFERVATSREEGYEGYYLASSANAVFTNSSVAVTMGEDEYLPLGDNSGHSLDGRYFGPVPERDIVGPAFAIYWPFSKRWGKSK